MQAPLFFSCFADGFGAARRLRLAVGASALVLFTQTLACSGASFNAQPSVASGNDGVHATADVRKTYNKVLRQWTRSAKIYQLLDNKMFVTATYHAPAFRRAFAVAFPDIYGHGGKITRRELVDLTGGVEQHHNFLLAIFTPDKRWNDLARDDSIWRMSLYSKSHGQESGEAEVAPDDIVPIKLDENLQAVYPYITRFDKVYLVRFPLFDSTHRLLVDADTDEMVLRIASAMGVATMRWKVATSGERLPLHPTVPMTPAGTADYADDGQAQGLR